MRPQLRYGRWLRGSMFAEHLAHFATAADAALSVRANYNRLLIMSAEDVALNSVTYYKGAAADIDQGIVQGGGFVDSLLDGGGN